MTAADGFAPAKINLSLHVVGRRADGYHRLDSLVVFAEFGDSVEIVDDPDAPPLPFFSSPLGGEAGRGTSSGKNRALQHFTDGEEGPLPTLPHKGRGLRKEVLNVSSGAPTLSIIGPFAAALAADAGNLVTRAAAAYADASGSETPRLRLTKRLPVASGLGGGSADAAATLRLLNRRGPTLPDDVIARLAAGLGADVPMCLASVPARVRGIGEEIEPLAGIPALPLVLANPGMAVSTPAVFAALQRRDNPLMPDTLPSFKDASAIAAWLATTRNDLQTPAIALAPGIETCLGMVVALPSCLLARMSGSGATVFGIFPDISAANQAAAELRRARPDWWVAATTTAAC